MKTTNLSEINIALHVQLSTKETRARKIKRDASLKKYRKIAE